MLNFDDFSFVCLFWLNSLNQLNKRGVFCSLLREQIFDCEWIVKRWLNEIKNVITFENCLYIMHILYDFEHRIKAIVFVFSVLSTSRHKKRRHCSVVCTTKLKKSMLIHYFTSSNWNERARSNVKNCEMNFLFFSTSNCCYNEIEIELDKLWCIAFNI